MSTQNQCGTCRKTITLKNLSEELKSLGIEKGDRIFVHSSFKKLGFEGDESPDDAVSLLKELVGAEGTLGMPVFSFSFSPEEMFDPKSSPSKVGAISEAFRKSDGVVRSISPSHSVAFWGKDADFCARSTCGLPPYSMAGPFGKLYQLDFKILMLGCGLAPNSTLHAVEHWAELPYCRNGIHHSYSVHDGYTDGALSAYMPVGHRDFYRGENSINAKYAKLLKRHDALISGMTGKSMSYLMSAGKLVDICMAELEKSPDLFLCDDKNCWSCRGNRYDFNIWKTRGGSRWNNVWLGAAKANITQGVGAYTNQGWGAGVPCEGVHDDIFARSLVFMQKAKKIVFISLDVCLIDVDVSMRIKKAIFEKTMILPEDVIIDATHTHFSPALGASRIWQTPQSRDDAYIGHLASVVAGTVYEAMKNLEPVSMAFSKKNVEIGNINRRIRMPDGTFKYFSNYTDVANGLKAKEFAMLFFKGRNGKVKAGIGSYASHPIFGSHWMRKTSGDYPGVFSAVSERELGYGAVVCFTKGACGDQMPSDYAKAQDGADKPGKKLAYTFLAESLDVKFKPLRSVSLKTKDYKVKNTEKSVETLLQALRIGDVRIGFSPAELFFAFERRFREKVGVARSLLVGSIDALGYFPTKDAFEHPTYEVNGCREWTGGMPGVGEELTDALAELTKSLE